jgi:HD-like signal output (HDOD) protein
VSIETSLENRKRPDLPRALTEVPPFPAVAVKALQVISNELGQLRELSELITADAAFSSEILRVVNSPLFGVNKEISSVLQAVVLLGLDRVKSVVVTVATRSYLNGSLDVPPLRACWHHSLACAVIAERLGRFNFIEPDIAYTAGLLHDIGRLGLIAAYPRKYADFLAGTEKDPCDAIERERDLFGIDHCQAGRLLAWHWKLPQIFVAITSKHHEAAVPGEPGVLTTVRQSCRMADVLGFNVVYPLLTKSYEQLIIEEFPERDRSRLPSDPTELALSIASKINSIESI